VPCGVAVALDRMERGTGELSATQEIVSKMGIPVVSIATLDDVLDYLRAEEAGGQRLRSIIEYRREYGVSEI
ncbi:MAG: orotate phosphoribosyltransferase, partial [Burkholderiales bacterium]